MKDLYDRIVVKKRALTHAQKFDRVIDILNNCKFDIVYMSKLTPLSHDQVQYFQDQIAWINGAIEFVTWFRDNMIPEKTPFWRKLWPF